MPRANSEDLVATSINFVKSTQRGVKGFQDGGYERNQSLVEDVFPSMNSTDKVCRKPKLRGQGTVSKGSDGKRGCGLRVVRLSSTSARTLAEVSGSGVCPEHPVSDAHGRFVLGPERPVWTLVGSSFVSGTSSMDARGRFICESRTS